MVYKILTGTKYFQVKMQFYMFQTFMCFNVFCISVINTLSLFKMVLAFKTGVQAFFGVQVLLNLFYKNYKVLGLDLKTSCGSLQIGDLVAVKFIRELKSSDGIPEEGIIDDSTFMCQIRRGMVTGICMDNTILEYCVYCLDFGYEVTVSEHFLLPLMRPFNLIPPLVCHFQF